MFSSPKLVEWDYQNVTNISTFWLVAPLIKVLKRFEFILVTLLIAQPPTLEDKE